MIKQVKKGEGSLQKQNIFCSQNSRNSDRSEGLQLQPSFTVQVRFVCHFS